MKRVFGKVALSREIIEHWVYDDPKILKVWISVILMANFKDGTLILGKTKHKIKRGQSSLSMRSWSHNLNMGVKAIDTIFNHFEEDGMIKREVIGVGKQSTTLITIVNYDNFQVLGETQAKREGITSEAQGNQKGIAKESQGADNRIKDNKEEERIIKIIGEEKFLILTSWLEYRKAIRKEIKVKSTLEALVEKFKNESKQKCDSVVDNSIQNGYQGLFWDRFISEPKNNDGKPTFNSPVL